MNSYQNQSTPNPNDQTLTCRDCKTPFLFTEGEQKFYADRQYTPPARCKPCRDANKARRDAGESGGGRVAQAAPPAVYEAPQGGGARKRGGGGGGRGNDREDWR